MTTMMAAMYITRGPTVLISQPPPRAGAARLLALRCEPGGRPTRPGPSLRTNPDAHDPGRELAEVFHLPRAVRPEPKLCRRDERPLGLAALVEVDFGLAQTVILRPRPAA